MCETRRDKIQPGALNIFNLEFKKFKIQVFS